MSGRDEEDDGLLAMAAREWNPGARRQLLLPADLIVAAQLPFVPRQL